MNESRTKDRVGHENPKSNNEHWRLLSSNLTYDRTFCTNILPITQKFPEFPWG